MNSHVCSEIFVIFTNTSISFPSYCHLWSCPSQQSPHQFNVFFFLFWLTEFNYGSQHESGFFISNYTTKGNVSMVFKNHFVLISIPLILWSLYNTKSSFNWETHLVTPQTKGDYEHHIQVLDIRAESLTLLHSFQLLLYLNIFMRTVGSI